MTYINIANVKAHTDSSCRVSSEYYWGAVTALLTDRSNVPQLAYQEDVVILELTDTTTSLPKVIFEVKSHLPQALNQVHETDLREVLLYGELFYKKM